MSVTALVPLKALAAAKGRLAGALGAPERERLAAWMATHVLTVCSASAAIAEVIVVAGDEAAAEVGRQAGAAVLLVPEPGLRVALDAADEATRTRLATLVVAADLPEVTVDEIDAVVRAGADLGGPAVVVAPTHDGGTGALLRCPPTAITTAYGPRSADAHIALARAAGVPTAVIRRHGLARDVDTPAHLPPRWLDSSSRP